MSATSFKFRYPLSQNPIVSDERNTVLYPYGRWADFATSGSWYLSGREIPERSYFGDDFNLSARPITRVIEPTVLEYAPIAPAIVDAEREVDVAAAAPVVVFPRERVLLNDRFAALGAQSQERRNHTLLWVLLALLGAAVLLHVTTRK